MKEIWRPISKKGLNTSYYASNLGRINTPQKQREHISHSLILRIDDDFYYNPNTASTITTVEDTAVVNRQKFFL